MTKPDMSYPDEEILAILKEVKTIALVGSSDKDDRPSNEVMKFLLTHGYDVIPVNPLLKDQKIAGRKVVASLKDINKPVDMVDIFRKSEAVEEIVDEILTLNHSPKVIWMQLDVIDKKSAKKATKAGIKVIMDRCPKIELLRLNVVKR